LPLRPLHLLLDAELLLHVMAHLMGDHIGLGEVARRPYLAAQLAIEVQVDVDLLFEGAVASACGTAQSAMGPFYCPNDQKVYIDLDFYRQLRRQIGAPGDFAQAYVIAHEVGHHVQQQLGIQQQVQRAQRQLPQRQANQLLVRLELQADCLAGVWANHTATQRNTLEPGDIEEALNAASRIGDDTLQRQSSGTVRPDSFTHGSSAQRQSWFRRGLESGDMKACDTFTGPL